MFFKPLVQVAIFYDIAKYRTSNNLVQEIDCDEHSELYQFIERLLTRLNVGFRIATSDVSMEYSIQIMILV
jgi:hypothetical protein